MKQYYEAHVTFTGGDREYFRDLTESLGWKFSAIDGDPNLGGGVKLYATRQMNLRFGEQQAVAALKEAAGILAHSGANVLRRKIEQVIFDDRSKEVRAACDGGCLECVSE